MKKITILHILHKLGCGGMENGTVNLVNFMERKKFANIICSLTPPDGYQYRINSERRITYNLNKKDGNDISVPFKIASIIKKEHVDIVHSRGWPTYLEGFLPAKLMCGHVKFIFSYHGKRIEDVPHIPKRRLYTERFLSFFVDCIMTLSGQMANEYASMINIKREKIKVIYNGVDIDKFRLTNAESNSLRKELNIEKDDYVIGFVGRVDPVKDIQTLINAVSIAKTHIQNIKLIIVGDGNERAKLQESVNRKKMENNVIFTGQRDDIPDCLSIMNLYVQPSLYEGMSNTIIEAMANGKVVVATEVGGTPELIEHEVDGLLFHPGSSEELAKYIIDLYKNPEKACILSDRACKKVKKQFSMSSMIKNYENLYMNLLG